MQGGQIKFLREVLGLSQVDFAPLIGRKYSSVQGYESGKRIPEEVAKRAMALAAQRGIALPTQEGLDTDVRTLHYRGSGTSDLAGTGTSGSDERARWHAFLDEILDSGQQDAITAAQQNLKICLNTVRDRRRLSALEKLS